jgi:NADH-quinone oxidoreductase subunit M
MDSIPILSILTFLPLAGALLLLFIDKSNKGLIRGVAFTTTVIVFLMSVPLYFYFENTHEMQFVEKREWIADWGIYYSLGIDGISLFLILLTTLTTAICVAATWTAIDKHVKEFMIAILLLETGMIGVFCALDFFLFYVLWEVMLIPMYLMIGIWGGQRRIYAAVKFFLFTMFGSVLMLVAILWLYFHHYELTGIYSFDILSYHGLEIGAEAQFWLFLAFFMAFAIKVPMFPFHTWLPDAHVEAPTVGSVILAGILLKMGTYGFLRFSLPIFPEATVDAVWWVSSLAIIGIIYGALVAMVQEDVKKLVAYSSVSHLGFVMLGIFALNVEAIEGGMLQMINHGISTGALFLIVGVLYERRHTRLISEYGGVAKKMPIFAVIFMIVTLSSIGLPGLNGFVGEFLILVGVWKVNPLFAVLATTGVIWAAVYMLWMYQRIMFGKITNPENEKLKDLNLREIAYFAPLIVFIFVLGIFPTPVIKKMEPTIIHLVEQTRTSVVVEMEDKKKKLAKMGVTIQPASDDGPQAMVKDN